MSMILWWRGLNRTQQIGFAVAAALMSALVVAAGFWALRPEFVPLFEGAPTEDNASVLTALQSLDSPYRIDPQSGLVMVPQERREELRLKLAQHGVVQKAPVGFELFNNSDFGMTEFSQRINYERGLEGEITRTIMTLDGVRYARVHLVLPDSSLFKKDEEQAKASVTLMTQPGHALSEGRIEGIRSLVAAAVPGLKPEAVSIHDDRGMDIATETAPVDAASPVNERERDEEAVEARLAAKVYDLLGAMFSPGSVAVSVDVRLHMDKVSSSRQDTSLEAPKNTELAQLRSELVDGAPDQSGTAASARPESAGGLAALAVHADAIVHRGSQYSEQVEKMPGTIEQLSVGVLVPDPLPPSVSLTQLQDLVSTAVGADARRGDHVTVYSSSLVKSPSIAAAEHTMAPLSGNPEGAPVSPGEAGLNGRESFTRAIIGLSLLVLLVLAFAVGRFSFKEPRLTKAERERLIELIRLELSQSGSREGSGSR